MNSLINEQLPPLLPPPPQTAAAIKKEIVYRDLSIMDLSESNSILLNPKDGPEDVPFSFFNSSSPHQPQVKQEKPDDFVLSVVKSEVKTDDTNSTLNIENTLLPTMDCVVKLPPIADAGALDSQGCNIRMFTPPTRISACASKSIGGSTEFQSISSKKFLSKYFHLPIVDAAKELGMCTTMLKKLCRRCGISRWPYRKLHSVDRILCCLREYVNSQEIEENLREEMRKDIANLEKYRENLISDPEHWMNSKASNDLVCLPAKRLRQLSENVPTLPTLPPLSSVSGDTAAGTGDTNCHQQHQQNGQGDGEPLPKRVRVAIDDFVMNN